MMRSWQGEQRRRGRARCTQRMPSRVSTMAGKPASSTPAICIVQCSSSRELTFIHERYHRQRAADLCYWLCRIKPSVSTSDTLTDPCCRLTKLYFQRRYDRSLDAIDRNIDAPPRPCTVIHPKQLTYQHT